MNPGEALEIRPASMQDYNAIARLLEANMPGGWSQSALRQTLARTDVLALLGARGEAPVGYALASWVLDEAEVILIGVGPRRQGIGRALMEALHEALASLGVRTVHLEVRFDNHAALALYSTLGYREVGRRPGYYRDGGEALLMSSALPG